MGLKQCPQCSEMVDEAKAFCPGCGNAFVEEEKREVSQFEKLDNTVQFGQTMYNQMLSDMGLNISKQPETEKAQEPALRRAEKPSQTRIEVIVPAAAAPAKPAAAKVPEPPKPASNTKWWILGGVLLLLLFLLVLAAAVGLYIYWTRFRVV